MGVAGKLSSALLDAGQAHHMAVGGIGVARRPVVGLSTSSKTSTSPMVNAKPGALITVARVAPRGKQQLASSQV